MKHLKKCWTFALAILLTLSVSIPTLASMEDTGFSDVDADAWYAEAVMYCQEHGLMNGTSNTTFEPEGSLTRAMLVTILYRNAGSPAVIGKDNFSDTIESAYYTDAVLWASQQGLVSGYGNGIFGTNDLVTREQMTAILWRYAGNPSTVGTAAFTDRASSASYAAAAINWAGVNNIVRPVSNNIFAPKENATRAQIAEALMNYDHSTRSVSSDTPNDRTKILVAYFSRYGNTDYNSDIDATTSASVIVEDGQRWGTTELIARMIAEQIDGDLHLIETAEAYPTDFNEVRDQNHQEISSSARPTLSSSVDMSSYDVIFVGYPVWASTAPTPVLSFLESQNLSGKTIIPFCTHDGYGAGRSFSTAAESAVGAKTLEGIAIQAPDVTTSANTITEWLDRIGLPANKNETIIRITTGKQELEGVLYDSSMAQQFIAQLPQTITMSNYGGREVYGSINHAITAEGEGQLRFDDGDITYCPSNNTAAIFYSQSSRPNLTMAIYPIGKITSDLSIFSNLPSRVEITFEVIS